MLIVAPPLGFYQILLPCWDCSDFESAIVHEVGACSAMPLACPYPACLPPGAQLGHLFTAPHAAIAPLHGLLVRTQLGHLFGLGHPDIVPLNQVSPSGGLEQYNPDIDGRNTYQALIAGGGRVNASNCMDLWNATFAGIPPGTSADAVEVGAGGYAVRNSVMEAFTQVLFEQPLLLSRVRVLTGSHALVCAAQSETMPH